jgi:hypothetical protein
MFEVHRSCPVIGKIYRQVRLDDYNSLNGHILPSVYAHVVQLPCSPISPVIVALKALPPAQALMGISKMQKYI